MEKNTGNRRNEGVANDARNGTATESSGAREVGGHDATADFKKFFADAAAEHVAKRGAVKVARESLKQLVEACALNGGQAYKIRALLFSLWNGKATPLIDLLDLDYGIRTQVLNVCMAFGWGGDKLEPEFFYDAIQGEFAAADLFTWFVKEGDAE